MKNLLITACLLGLTQNLAFAEELMPKTNQQPRHFQNKIKKTLSADYLLFLPSGYNARASNRWPLILFLHGAGERGTNLNQVTVHGPPKLVKSKPEFPFIVVSPQCPPGQWWSNDLVIALLDDVVRKHKIDTNRIYLTGLSMGGFGTWNLAATHPERFAAIAPICGGGDSLPLLLADKNKTAKLKSLGVWAFHGAKDEAVKLAESERMIELFRRLGNDAKLTVYPNAGHDSWTETYNNPALFKWFLQHRR